MAKASKKTLCKKADILWSKVVRLRDGNHCQVCGKNSSLNAHHLIHKAVRFFRHDPENGICLCSGCHIFSNELSAHGASWAFDDWMKEHRPDQFEWWVKNRNELHFNASYDYEKRAGILKAELAALEGE